MRVALQLTVLFLVPICVGILHAGWPDLARALDGAVFIAAWGAAWYFRVKYMDKNWPPTA